MHKLTGLKINHVLYVDLAGFQGVVDTLGGVDMCIPGENVNTPDRPASSDELTALDVAAGMPEASAATRHSRTCAHATCVVTLRRPTSTGSPANSSSCER